MDGGWGPTAVGGMLTVVIAALGTWALRIYSKRLDTMLSMKKLDVGAEKGANARTVKELRESNAALAKDLATYRDEVHDWRDKAHAAQLSMTVAQEQFKRCEADKDELWEYIGQMVGVLRQHGMEVPIRAPKESAPSESEG